MSHSKRLAQRNFALVILAKLGWPMIWGMALWVGFYVLIQQGILTHQLLVRYFAGHPIEYIESALFFVGLAAIGLRVVDLVGQHFLMRKVALEPAPPEGQPVDDCQRLMATLDKLPEPLQATLLTQRLRDALTHVHRRDTADGLEDELKYLADVDASRSYDSYALVRLIVWAIPILGFLGTVVGITMALSSLNLAPGELENSLDSLTSGLGIAFDTTTLALTLSIVLMFSQFLSERIEADLLTKVDERTNEELVGRFETSDNGVSPQLVSIRRMAETVIKATETLVHRQADIWQASIDAAHHQWSQLFDATGTQLESALSAVTEQTIKHHAAQLEKSETAADQRQQRVADLLNGALTQHAERMRSQQAEMVKQGDVMRQAIDATGRVQTLQQALNENLRALAGAQNFEETVMSLSAAIQLLSARVGHAKGADQVALEADSSEAKGRAA